MRITEILPSSQFTWIAGSIVLSGGLIYAAHFITHPKPAPASVSVASQTSVNADWKATLDTIQATSPLNRAPQGVSQNKVDDLLAAATSDNLTDTVAKTLFINLSSAKSQGLGNDIPTQDQIVADAVAKINQASSVPVYTSADLTLSSDASDALKAYGNAFMLAVQKHPKANHDMTLYTVATSTENTDPARLSPLTGIAADYAALARDMVHTPTPPTLAVLQLQVANNIAKMAGAVADMKMLYTDPLRALAGLQLYDALNQETLRLFTNIAQNLSQDGILFTNGEPGAAWSSLVP